MSSSSPLTSSLASQRSSTRGRRRLPAHCGTFSSWRGSALLEPLLSPAAGTAACCVGLESTLSLEALGPAHATVTSVAEVPARVKSLVGGQSRRLRCPSDAIVAGVRNRRLLQAWEEAADVGHPGLRMSLHGLNLIYPSGGLDQVYNALLLSNPPHCTTLAHRTQDAGSLALQPRARELAGAESMRKTTRTHTATQEART